jgi:Histidine kinase-, DNA gyrase B-, and HSP90-like ATPase
MTRWSLRRRFGVTQDTERRYQPEAAEPEAGRNGQSASQPDAATAGQPGAAPQASWFAPGRGRQAPAGSAQAGTGPYGVIDTPASPAGPGQQGTPQYSASQYSAAQYGAGVHGRHPGPLAATSQPGGVAVLAPVQPPGWQAAAAAPAGVRDAPAEQGQVAELTTRQGFWPDICDQFGLHLLVLAEQLRASLDELEADEGDPERLRRLYQVDHAVTRMRRASRDLRTLAGRSEEELAGFTTSLLDVIRMAASAIERYTQITVGRVADLAVLGYAADDVGSLMAALLDNATRYSPGAVSVSCHLLEDGGVMFRVEDTGIGMGMEQVNTLNATLAGPVPDVDERTGRHTGFPVVHRIARKHSIGVRVAARPLPSSGTIAMVTLPPHLLCEVPAEEAQRRPASAAGSAAQPAPRPATIPDLPRGEPGQPPAWEPPELPDRDQQPGDRQPGDQQSAEQQQRHPGALPRRERASLRGDGPRPKQQEPVPVPTPEQQAAARRAFADELNAFSLGSAGALDTGDDTAPEEEA